MLIGWMNQYNDWCRRHICAVVPSVPATGKNAVVQSATSTRGVMHHIAVVYSHFIGNGVDIDSADVFSQFLSTQDYSSHAEDFLETRLNTYIEKNNTVNKMQKSLEGSTDSSIPLSNNQDSLTVCDSVVVNKYRQLLHSELQTRLQSAEAEGDLLTDPVVQSLKQYLDQQQHSNCTSSSSSSNANVVSLDSTTTSVISTDSDVPLFCLCRLPETHGESSVMSQCDLCDDWFHPQCINAPLVSATAMRRHDASFICPVCLHMTGRVSAFSLPPVTEWKRIHANQQVKEEKGKGHTSSGKTHKKTNSSGAKKRPHWEVEEEDCSSPVRKVNRRLSAIEKRESTGVHVESPHVTGDVQVKAEPLSDLASSLPSAHLTIQSTSSTKKAPPKKPTAVPALRPRDFLSLQDVQSGMEEEQRMTISGVRFYYFG
jgi:hypothetical protein